MPRRRLRGAMTSRPCAILPALLLASGALLAAVPTAEGHVCVTQTYQLYGDPSGCNAHDCGDPEDREHLGHVVWHRGDNSAIHACGHLLDAISGGALP